MPTFFLKPRLSFFTFVLLYFPIFIYHTINDSFAGGAPCTPSCTDTYATTDNFFCGADTVTIGGSCYNGNNTGISKCLTIGCLGDAGRNQKIVIE